MLFLLLSAVEGIYDLIFIIQFNRHHSSKKVLFIPTEEQKSQHMFTGLAELMKLLRTCLYVNSHKGKSRLPLLKCLGAGWASGSNVNAGLQWTATRFSFVSIFWLSLSLFFWLHSQVSDGGWMTTSKSGVIFCQVQVHWKNMVLSHHSPTGGTNCIVCLSLK